MTQLIVGQQYDLSGHYVVRGWRVQIKEIVGKDLVRCVVVTSDSIYYSPGTSCTLGVNYNVQFTLVDDSVKGLVNRLITEKYKDH